MRCIQWLNLVLWTGLFGVPATLHAWDYAGHRMVNQLALAALPTNFPGFVFTAEARERITFLAGEADRWRNVPDPAFRHCNGPDHFLDLDDLPKLGLRPDQISPFRYEFLAQLIRGRQANARQLPPIDPARDHDRTRALVGFLPWTINEQYAKLKSAFAYLRAFETLGTPEEIANARQNVVYLMGVMGHFVADATQPLHATKHYNGWVGPNPRLYTTNRAFHQWIDGDFIEKVGLTAEALRPRLQSAKRISDRDPAASATNLFPAVLTFLVEQSTLVEPLYQLQQDGKLAETGEPHPEGVDFISRQLLKGAQMLGDLWLTAWHEAPADKYLTDQLTKRKLGRAKP